METNRDYLNQTQTKIWLRLAFLVFEYGMLWWVTPSKSPKLDPASGGLDFSTLSTKYVCNRSSNLFPLPKDWPLLTLLITYKMGILPTELKAGQCFKSPPGMAQIWLEDTEPAVTHDPRQPCVLSCCSTTKKQNPKPPALGFILYSGQGKNRSQCLFCRLAALNPAVQSTIYFRAQISIPSRVLNSH